MQEVKHKHKHNKCGHLVAEKSVYVHFALWLAKKNSFYVRLRLAEKPAVFFIKPAVNQKKIRLRVIPARSI